MLCGKQNRTAQNRIKALKVVQKQRTVIQSREKRYNAPYIYTYIYIAYYLYIHETNKIHWLCCLARPL